MQPKQSLAVTPPQTDLMLQWLEQAWHRWPCSTSWLILHHAHRHGVAVVAEDAAVAAAAAAVAAAFAAVAAAVAATPLSESAGVCLASGCCSSTALKSKVKSMAGPVCTVTSRGVTRHHHQSSHVSFGPAHSHQAGTFGTNLQCPCDCICRL